MKYEDEYILHCCRFLNPDYVALEELHGQNLDYIYILGQLMFNRVGGVGWHTLANAPFLGKLNREFRNPLKAVYEAGVQKGDSFARALDLLFGILAGVKFPYALLKGSYLAGLYPPGLRTSNDIDILINFENITDISKLFLDIGFVQGYQRNDAFTPATRAQVVSSQMNRGETVPFVKQMNWPQMKYLEIDVNLSLDFKPGGDGAVVAGFLENAAADIQTGCGGALMTLARDDFLIQLCAHIYKEATTYNWVEFGRDQGLYKYLDIYLMLAKFGGAVNCEKINGLGLQKECYYALNGANELFGAGVPLNGIEIDDLGFMKTVTDVAGKKTYRHDMDFVDWVFCPKRKEHLREVAF